ILAEAGSGEITTEILDAPPGDGAEGYHQPHLDENPRGYCGLDGMGLVYPAS
ncbi:MAG: peptide-methionine (S)-S-oxide reductase, partial [bacterium]|nr:peptide-methionine (S)-S-oxide reductase [bacterium]